MIKIFGFIWMNNYIYIYGWKVIYFIIIELNYLVYNVFVCMLMYN